MIFQSKCYLYHNTLEACFCLFRFNVSCTCILILHKGRDWITLLLWQCEWQEVVLGFLHFKWNIKLRLHGLYKINSFGVARRQTRIVCAKHKKDYNHMHIVITPAYFLALTDVFSSSFLFFLSFLPSSPPYITVYRKCCNDKVPPRCLAGPATDKETD